MMLHYLDSSVPARPDQSLDELELQLARLPEEAQVVPELGAVAEGLAAQPGTPRARKLAGKIHQALETHLQHLFVFHPPAGFPLPPEWVERYQVHASAWRALGLAYAHWCPAREERVEAGWLVGAIACLGRVLCLSGFYHCQSPPGMWRDLHTLFQRAARAGLGRARVKCPWLRHRASTTPEAEYARALLTGLADPYGLLPPEVPLLDSLLEKWAPLVRITDTAGEGWRIDTEADVPARWEASAKGQGPRLDLTGLVSLLAEHGQLATPVGRFEYWRQPGDTIAAGLLEYLKGHWFRPAEATGFLKVEAPVDWVVGLKAVFARLQGQAGRAIPVAAMDRGRARIPTAAAGSLQVGDLVGVFAPRNGEDGLVGMAVVARLVWSGPGEAADRPEALQVQLQAIPGEVYPVGIQPLYRIRLPLAYQRGLLLAEGGDLNLLLAGQQIPEGLVVRLLHGPALYPVRLHGCHYPARATLRCRCVSAADVAQK